MGGVYLKHHRVLSYISVYCEAIGKAQALTSLRSALTSGFLISGFLTSGFFDALACVPFVFGVQDVEPRIEAYITRESLKAAVRPLTSLSSESLPADAGMSLHPSSSSLNLKSDARLRSQRPDAPDLIPNTNIDHHATDSDDLGDSSSLLAAHRFRLIIDVAKVEIPFDDGTLNGVRDLQVEYEYAPFGRQVLHCERDQSQVPSPLDAYLITYIVLESQFSGDAHRLRLSIDVTRI